MRHKSNAFASSLNLNHRVIEIAIGMRRVALTTLKVETKYFDEQNYN